MTSRIGTAILLAAIFAAPAFAHDGELLKPHDLWTAWAFDPGIVVPLVLSGWLYVRGIRRAPVRRTYEVASYTIGWAALAAALVSPIHPLGEVLFSVHMTQHGILMLIAAPLLVAGRPLAPYLFGIPTGARKMLVRFTRQPAFQGAWKLVTGPFVATAAQGIILWMWHAPALYQRTLKSDAVHSIQHLSFLVSALLFWWAVFHGRRGRAGYGAGAACVFITAVHTTVLGALLTVAPALWYPLYSERTAAWGLTPLEDQQLAGLVMWVPGGVVYLVASLVLVFLWLNKPARPAGTRQIGRSPEFG